MADNEKKTVRVEELALSNSLTLAALVGLLEEQGIIRREEVLDRARVIRDRGNLMPHTYLEDVKKIINTVSTDEELILEEKLILLGLVTDHLTRVTKTLEDELATRGGSLIQ